MCKVGPTVVGTARSRVRMPGCYARSSLSFITGFSSLLGSCDLPPNEKAEIEVITAQPEPQRD